MYEIVSVLKMNFDKNIVFLIFFYALIACGKLGELLLEIYQIFVIFFSFQNNVFSSAALT